MSRSSTALVAMLLLGSVSGCASARVFERGLPRRVEVTREAGEPSTQLAVDVLPGRELEISVAQARAVELRRQIVYGTTLLYRDWKRNPMWELVEIPLGAIVLVTAPFVLLGDGDSPDTDSLKHDVAWNRFSSVVGFINPGQAMLGTEWVRDSSTKEEPFRSPEQRVAYRMALPQPNVHVEYRLLDASGNVTKSGEAATDAFGAMKVTEVPATTVQIVVRSGDSTITQAIHFPGETQ